jgi:hypothetical protein
MRNNPLWLQDAENFGIKQTVVDYLEKFMARGTSIKEDPTPLMKIFTIGNLVFNMMEECQEIAKIDIRNFEDLCSEILYQQMFVCFVECPRKMKKRQFHEIGFFN